MRKNIAVVLALILIGTTLSGCQNRNRISESDSNQHNVSNEKENKTVVLSCNYYLDSYTSQIYSGCRQACEELGYTPDYVALNANPYVADGIAKSEYYNDDVIAVCVKQTSNTPSDDILKDISDTKVLVTMDNAVSELNTLCIQPAESTVIGDVLLQSAVDACKSDGKVIILARADGDESESEYIDTIMQTYDSNRSKYKNIEIADIYYSEYSISGFNEAAKNILKDHPDCDCIIALSPAAMLQAAKVVYEKEYDTKVTGLGMPSEMELYIINGIVQRAYLWDPSDYGYLISMTMDALYRGAISGKEGESFKAGRLGNFVVEKGSRGENRIILGLPMKFDINNISTWSKVF